MGKTLQLKIEQIVTNAGTQVRVQHSREAITEFSEAVEDGDEFPPIVVFFDGKRYYLADGFHRLLAHLEAGSQTILADVREGTARDAILYAAGHANAEKRAVRLTQADKDKARRMIVSDPEWAKEWSDREMARRFPHLGTDKTFATTRRMIEAEREEKSEGCGIPHKGAKPVSGERCVSRGKKSHVSKTVYEPPSRVAEAKAADIFQEAQLDYLDELEPVVERGLVQTERLKLKRTHGMMERMKVAIEADKRRLLA